MPPARTLTAEPGSPPPMRGKARQVRPMQTRLGITPAHAGKSNDAPSLYAKHMDHPRPCGEKTVAASIVIRMAGSPPPMRGKGYARDSRVIGVRITPAHAGKRPGVALLIENVRDHPRPCGEKYPV